MNPEVGFQEFETSKYIKEQLTALGLSYKEFAKTGVTAEIQGGLGEGKTMLIRADIDALPLQESNDLPFKSKNDGVMHACGHDTHVACLLGTAELLNNNKDKFKGKVLLVFQPAEEGPGGAKPMVEEGAVGDVNNPDIDASLALHVDNSPVRTITVKDNEMSAAADEFYITIKGKGGHGSAPHEAVDPIYLAGLIMVNLQGFISRTVDPMEPMVFTVGKIVGGDRHNIIPATAYMEATLRTMNRELRKTLHSTIHNFIVTTAELHGGDAEVEIEVGYDVGINSPEINKYIRSSFKELYPDYEFTPMEKAQLGAEDFYEFSLGGKIPTSMFMLGGGNKDKGIIAPNHSNYFTVDEECLSIGVSVLSQTAIKYLNDN